MIIDFSAPPENTTKKRALHSNNVSSLKRVDKGLLILITDQFKMVFRKFFQLR